MCLVESVLIASSTISVGAGLRELEALTLSTFCLGITLQDFFCFLRKKILITKGTSKCSRDTTLLGPVGFQLLKLS